MAVAAQDPRARTSDSDRPVGFLHSAHALAVLEFARVLETVAGYASTPSGAARVRALEPRAVRDADHDSLAWIVGEHARVTAMRSLLAREGGWAGHPIPDLEAPLERLRISGTAWTAPDIRAAIVLLASSRQTRAALDAARRDGAPIGSLDGLGASLLTEPALEKVLERVVDEEGNVRDSASPALKRIRKDLRGAEGEIVRGADPVVLRHASSYRLVRTA